MGKILAIDYGRKRIGLALSDEDKLFAFTLTSVSAGERDILFQRLLKRVQEHKPEIILVGVPLGIDSKPTQMSIEVENFIKKLKVQVKSEIIKWNEVGTSKLAQLNLRHTKKRSIDSESARIILQEYLDFRKNK